MKTDALRFIRFRAAKMPGFSEELKPDGDFGAQVTLVVGENASGKSSMARCLNTMIWQGRSSGIMADASAKTDQHQLTFGLDGPHHSLLGLEQKSFENRLPDKHFGGNYYLALDELIRGLDAQITQTFLNELNGGLDPDQLRRKLRAEDLKVSRSTSEAQSLAKAKEDLKRIQSEQALLAKRKTELLRLEEEKEASRTAQKRIQLLKALRDLRLGEQDLVHQKDELKHFDASMERLAKGDDERLLEAMDSLSAAASARQGEQNQVDQWQARREELNLPEGGLPEALVLELDTLAARALDLEKAIETEERNALVARQEAQDLLRAIDPEAGDAVLEELPADWADRNAALYSAYLEDFAQKKSIEGELEMEIERSANTEGLKSSEVYHSAIHDLQSWLGADHQEVFDAQSKPANAFLPLVILAIVALLMTGMQHFGFVPWYVSAVLIVLIAVVLAWLGKSGPSISRKEVSMVEENRARIQQAFEARKVNGSPLAWNRKGVIQMLSDLYPLLEKSKRQEAAEMNVRKLKGSLQNIDQQIAQHERAQQLLREQLGTAVKLPESSGASALYSYVDKVQQALRVFALTGGCEAAAERNRKELKECLQALNDKCNAYTGEQANDLRVESVIARWKVLKKKSSDYEERTRAWKECKRALEVAEAHEQQAKERLKAESAKFGKNEPDVHLAKEQMAQWERYQAALQSLRLAEGTVNRLRADYETLAAEHAERSMFESESAGELELLIKENEVQAEGFESIVRKVQELEGELERTAKGHDLEQAMQKVDEAYQSLMNLFEDNLQKSTYAVVLDTLQQHRKSDQNSGLFSRADHYFRMFTHGKYRLDIENVEQLSFSAWDVVLDRPVAFKNLSTGTQIQLRLAARMAVIEEREGDLRLPIFADELLANSDDLRAKAIIDALIEIARDGRQVFYFTAQGDEVAKWKESLEGSDLAWSEVHMRSNGRPKLPTSGRSVPLFEEVPAIEDHDRNTYAKAVGVPGFDLLRDEPGALNLWYLIDDLRLLYTCLTRHLQTWGQLEHYYESGGHIEGYTREHHRQFQNAMKGLHTALQLLRRGLSKAIDRDVLIASGAISDTYMERVLAIVKKHNGDPEVLLQALSEGEVSGFRRNNTEKLQAFLEEEGYLDEAEPLGEGAFKAELASKQGGNPNWEEILWLLNELLPSDWFAKNTK